MGKAYYQDKAFGMIFGDTEFNTPAGRIFWLGLVTPKAYRGKVAEGEKQPAPKYEATIAFSKEHPKAQTFLKAIADEADMMISQYNGDIGKKMPIGQPAVFQDGDEMDHELYPWTKGCWVITARNKDFVPCVDKAGDEYDPKDLAGGMIGKLAIRVRLSSKGLSFNLRAVQFIEDDGQRFGGGAKTAAELFSACGDDVEEGCTKECAEKVLDDKPSTKAEETAAPVVAPAKGQKGKSAIVNML